MRKKLDRILTSEDPREGLFGIMDTVLGQETLPELYALKALGAKGHKDNYWHSIQVCYQAIPYTSLRLRWAALYHDVGKAPTRRYDGGKVTFQGHETLGGRLTRQRLRALGYEADFVNDVCALVEFSGRVASFSEEWTNAAVRRIVRDMGHHLIQDAAALVAADCTSKYVSNHRAAEGRARGFLQAWERVQIEDAEAARRPPIDGVRVMELLNMKPGRKVGEILRWLLENYEQASPEDAERAVLATYAPLA